MPRTRPPWTSLLVFVLAFALAPASVPAQEAPADEEPVAPAEPEEVTVAELAERWLVAWREGPVLVAAEEGAEVPDPEDRGAHIRAALEELNRKSLSNRAWKEFWEQQRELVTALSARIQAEEPDSPRLEELQRWVQLAESKIASQDVLMSALQARSAAIEEELDLPPPPETIEITPLSEDAGPYIRRTARIADLKRSITTQTRRQGEDRDLLAYLEAQAPSEAELLGALRTDRDLADAELAIARAGADRRPRSELTPIWKEIGDAASTKTRRIAGDLARRELDRRNRELEVSLLTSELDLRRGRLAELNAKLEAERGLPSLIDATQQSVMLWLRHKAPLVALRLLLIVLAAFLALRFVRRVAGSVISRAEARAPDDTAGKQRRETLIDVFSSLVRLLVLGTAALLALSELGVNTKPILGSFAILGLAISFGSQNLVKDVVNGFFILLENQYAVGDVVEIGGQQGTVERITLRTTWLRSGLTGALYAISNGDISGVGNHTRDWSGVATEVGVGYDTDLEQLRDIVNAVGLEFAEDPEWKDRFLTPPASQGVIRLDDSAVVIRLSGKVKPGTQWAADRELKARLKKALDAEGIEIPFPQQVLHTPRPPAPPPAPAAESAPESEPQGE